MVRKGNWKNENWSVGVNLSHLSPRKFGAENSEAILAKSKDVGRVVIDDSKQDEFVIVSKAASDVITTEKI